MKKSLYVIVISTINKDGEDVTVKSIDTSRKRSIATALSIAEKKEKKLKGTLYELSKHKFWVRSNTDDVMIMVQKVSNINGLD